MPAVPAASAMMILNRQRRVSVAIAPLAEFLERIRRELRFPPNGVAVRLVSDATMARLNRAFRGKAGSTDVLSFPANGARPALQKPRRSRASAPDGDYGYVGDIAIAPETARRNARLYSRSLPEELRILILHGMIHLAGYDHETDNGRMNRLERRLRARFGLKTL
jgi:probable rRNA maturation factor